VGVVSMSAIHDQTRKQGRQDHRREIIRMVGVVLAQEHPRDAAGLDSAPLPGNAGIQAVVYLDWAKNEQEQGEESQADDQGINKGAAK
jgi:hypothetical protein